MVSAQEFVNELFVWITAYFMLYFTDWVPDEVVMTGTTMNFKNFMGLVMLGVIGLFVFTNLMIMIVSSIKISLTTWKRKNAMLKRAKELAKKLEEDIQKACAKVEAKKGQIQKRDFLSEIAEVFSEESSSGEESSS